MLKPLLLALATACCIAAAPAAPYAASPEKKICRSMTPVGSRIPSRPVCKTRAQWSGIDKAAANEAKELTDQFKDQRPAGLN